MKVYVKRLRDVCTGIIKIGTEAYHWQHNWKRIVGRIDVEGHVHGGATVDDSMDCSKVIRGL